MLLYIEDQDLNLRLVERILNPRTEYRLVTAMQGGLGLDIAREHHPDLILLDLNLPDMSGDEVLRRLKDDPQVQHIPVIMVSADAMGDRIEQMHGNGRRGISDQALQGHRVPPRHRRDAGAVEDLVRNPATTFLLVAVALSSSCAKERAFTPPPPDRIAALLEFPMTPRDSKPGHVASQEDSWQQEKPKRKRVMPLASFFYSSDSETHLRFHYIVTQALCMPGPGDLPCRAAQQRSNDGIQERNQMKALGRESFPSAGVFKTTDVGPLDLQFPLGFGPGR